MLRGDTRLEGQVGVGQMDVVGLSVPGGGTKARRGVRQVWGGTQYVWGATPAPQRPWPP